MTATAVLPSGASFDDFDDIQPITSWADIVEETEFDASEVVIPSWADLDAEVPEPSARVQRRVENPSSVRRVFSQKSDSRVWRKQAPSPSYSSVRSSQASEARKKFRRNNFGFPQEERMGGAKLSSKAPTTATPSPQHWRRSPPSGFINRPERPVQDASPPQRRSLPSGFINRPERPVRDASPPQHRSPPSGFIKRPERPVRDTSPSQFRSPPSGFFNRQESHVREASPSQHKSPRSGLLKKLRPSQALYSPPQRQGPATSSSENGVSPLQNTTPAKTVAQKREMGGQEIAVKPPITPTPAPEPERQGPATSSSENGVSPLQNTTPAKTVAQKREMGGQEIAVKPPITPTPAPEPERQGPATSSSENGVSPLQNTTPAKTVAQKQEMGGPEIAIKPPITPTPAPEPEHTTLPSRLFKKSFTEASPLRPKPYPPGFFKRLEPTDTAPPQNTSLPSDFIQKLRAALTKVPLLQHQDPSSSSSRVNGVSPQEGPVAQKREMGGPEIAVKPPITPTPAPEPDPKPYPPGFFKRLEPTDASPPQHQYPATRSSRNRVNPQDGENTTLAKTFPQRQGVRSSFRTECSLEDLCKMLDGLHLSEKPTLSLTPDSPKPLLRPANFVFKTRPTFGFSQHQTAGRETWKKPPAPPTSAAASEHLPAPHSNPKPSVLDDKKLQLIRKRPRLSSD
ncbi:hypothetical protein IRJ41_023067, partial [Triplophysa rosa]